MIKHDFNFVKCYFEEYGCELLDPEYKNNSTKMKYRCSCGETSYISFANFRYGRRCKKCGHIRTSKSQSLKYENVYKEFENNNCMLLEKEYKNARTSMRYLCSCGNESSICYDSFRIGRRCRNCGGNKSPTFDEVKSYFNKCSCMLLENEYKNAHESMKYRCSCGEISTTSWTSFKSGRRCRNCGGNKSPTFDEVKSYFNKCSCMLLENEYKNNITKMKYVCVCGNIGNTSWENFKNKNIRCTFCQKIKRSNSAKTLTTEEAKARKFFRKRCYSLVEITLKATGRKKHGKTKDILGYSPMDLRSHLTKHPNWDSVKNEIWHIDHIFPIKAFLDYKILDLQLINSLKNLQPILGEDNKKKSCKYNKSEFEHWLDNINK